MKQEELKKQNQILLEAQKIENEYGEKSVGNNSIEDNKAPREQSEKTQSKHENRDEQPKRADFPLDHVLPVFNITRADEISSKKQFPSSLKKNQQLALK